MNKLFNAFLCMMLGFAAPLMAQNPTSPTKPANTTSCDCEITFNWLKTTQAKAPLSLAEFQAILKQYLRFYRNGHLRLDLSEQGQAAMQAAARAANNIAPNSASNSHPKPPLYKINSQDFLKYIAQKKTPDLEGVWQTGSYKIGIKKEGTQYIGFILSSGVEDWTPGLFKLQFQEDAQQKLSGTFYLRDFSTLKPAQIIQIGHNWINLGSIDLFRVDSPFEEKPMVSLHLKSIQTIKPFIEQLNAKTLYFRIPSFDPAFKPAIDSVIRQHKSLIQSTENLIIDLKNGTGGSDNSYAEIIPLLYTNPIRSIGVEFLSTKLNNERMLKLINTPAYNLSEAQKVWARESYDKLEKQLGQFVNLREQEVSIYSQDSVYAYPKKVGILVNEANGSTDEQFLLAAKQSQKVKIFGRRTQGVLDVSNMHFVSSPCQNFELGYALSRSKRLPDFPIDDIGIQPDYFLDKQIPDWEWIPFIHKILNGY